MTAQMPTMACAIFSGVPFLHLRSSPTERRKLRGHQSRLAHYALPDGGWSMPRRPAMQGR
jgi:hypothetical protein